MAYLYTFITGVIVTLLYAALIYLLTGLIVWVSIITTGLGFLALAFLCRNYHNENYGANADRAGGEVSD